MKLRIWAVLALSFPAAFAEAAPILEFYGFRMFGSATEFERRVREIAGGPVRMVSGNELLVEKAGKVTFRNAAASNDTVCATSEFLQRCRFGKSASGPIDSVFVEFSIVTGSPIILAFALRPEVAAEAYLGTLAKGGMPPLANTPEVRLDAIRRNDLLGRCVPEAVCESVGWRWVIGFDELYADILYRQRGKEPREAASVLLARPNLRETEAAAHMKLRLDAPANPKFSEKDSKAQQLAAKKLGL